ncbi:MAG TPA: phage protein GemA/Gp16 family protein [Opitutaceae bacterium]|jgi:hypothetical protein
MNAAQTGLYWREWALTRDWYRAHGKSASQTDDMRHALHERALGHSKSSKDFTNPDLDKILATFRAVHDGGNLEAQLRAEEQPAMRKQALIANVREVVTGIVDRPGNENAYLNGLAKRVFRVMTYQELDEAQLTQLRGILFARLAQIRRATMLGKFKDRAASPNPF